MSKALSRPFVQPLMDDLWPQRRPFLGVVQPYAINCVAPILGGMPAWCHDSHGAQMVFKSKVAPAVDPRPSGAFMIAPRAVVAKGGSQPSPRTAWDFNPEPAQGLVLTPSEIADVVFGRRAVTMGLPLLFGFQAGSETGQTEERSSG